MARAIWSGTISFGLVNVPVKLYSAVHSKDLQFHQFDPKGNRIRQKEGLSYGSTSQLTVSDLDKAGRFTMQAICNPVNIDKVDRAAAEELARFLNDGMTSDEVAEAKKAYLQSRKVGRAGDQAIAAQLLDGLHTGRTMAFYADLEKRIEELTAPDVTVAFRKHVDPAKLTVIRAGDFKK